MKTQRLTKFLALVLIASTTFVACKKGNKDDGAPKNGDDKEVPGDDDDNNNTDEDNTAPTITLTSAKTYILSTEKVNLIAVATDDVGVTKVEFYKGTTKLGDDTTAPFEFEYTPTTAEAVLGSTLSNFTAKAYDQAGNLKESTALSIPVAVRIEMESGTLVADKPGEKKDDAVASGGQRVRGMDNAGCGIDVPVTIPATGKYVLNIAGATGFDGSNGALVTIDGTVTTQQYALFPNGGWNTFNIKSLEYDLTVGDRMVNFRKESNETTGWADYDYFDIYKK